MIGMEKERCRKEDIWNKPCANSLFSVVLYSVKEEVMDLSYEAFGDPVASNELEPSLQVYAVSHIVDGLCENLKNVHHYRLLLQEEIKHILKKQQTY
jgi:hypothetical protein